ncbi:MAG: creatininase family protein [Bacteroidetes bacterium]|nr:creatininase family protein [Bacteroidota bacterium]
MHISSLNWKQVESYLEKDDRCVLPIGSTEQHAYLSLSTDSILAERISIEAAEPLEIPVFPVVHYGITPLFMDYPGTVSLQPSTLNLLMKDIIDSIAHHGFRHILLVNGHGGNIPLMDFIAKQYSSSAISIKFHNWWKAEKTWKKVMEIDPVASHASWMENFPWTRLAGVSMPGAQKKMCDLDYLKKLNAKEAREYLGDGNYGGCYQRKDEELFQLWQTAVLETRALLETGW